MATAEDRVTWPTAEGLRALEDQARKTPEMRYVTGRALLPVLSMAHAVLELQAELEQQKRRIDRAIHKAGELVRFYERQAAGRRGRPIETAGEVEIVAMARVDLVRISTALDDWIRLYLGEDACTEQQERGAQERVAAAGGVVAYARAAREPIDAAL